MKKDKDDLSNIYFRFLSEGSKILSEERLAIIFDGNPQTISHNIRSIKDGKPLRYGSVIKKLTSAAQSIMALGGPDTAAAWFLQNGIGVGQEKELQEFLTETVSIVRNLGGNLSGNIQSESLKERLIQPSLVKKHRSLIVRLPKQIDAIVREESKRYARPISHIVEAAVLKGLSTPETLSRVTDNYEVSGQRVSLGMRKKEVAPLHVIMKPSTQTRLKESIPSDRINFFIVESLKASIPGCRPMGEPTLSPPRNFKVSSLPSISMENQSEIFRNRSGLVSLSVRIPDWATVRLKEIAVNRFGFRYATGLLMCDMIRMFFLHEGWRTMKDFKVLPSDMMRSWTVRIPKEFKQAISDFADENEMGDSVLSRVIVYWGLEGEGVAHVKRISP